MTENDKGGPGPAPPAATLAAAGRGLDWLNLFVANIQTGFGPFISVYLTTEGWTQTGIGFALSLGTVMAMASQLPAGALVDAISSKTRVALFSILAFTASALMFAFRPTPLFVYTAEILHGFSSCTLGPAVAALSLAVAGRAALGPRLGRNARFASLGNGIGAALMGACGYLLSNQSVFVLTAILTLPAIAALAPLKSVDTPSPDALRAAKPSLAHVLADRRLLIFAVCVALFTFANAALLPLAGSELTARAGGEASLFIAAGIVLPQAVVALISPTVGSLAETQGRRVILITGFAMLPLRGLLFALFDHPTAIVMVQVFDGFAAACFGIMLPLVTADIAGHSGHFNASLGFVGFAVGIGATLSTTVAGWLSDHFGNPAAFITLGMIGFAATIVVWLYMPETKPSGVPAA